MELENRRRIYHLIEKFPGIHFRELFRKLKISMGSFEYHINVLEKDELIYSKKEDHYTRYFIKGKLGEEDKELATLLRNDKLRRILFTLILDPGLSHKSLTAKLGWPKSTISFYLKKLFEKNIVEERSQKSTDSVSSAGKPQKGLYIKRPDKIVNLVVLYKTGFFDELSNRILDLVEVL
ncbi:MAG: winged helix-turn-helix transcriptional regulator [Thermoplasmata archaeon]|nr:winged helix-turn-helix transcriptional regulator [Thermoplasmata archaeon]